MTCVDELIITEELTRIHIDELSEMMITNKLELSEILTKYQDFTDLFLKKSADKLPEHYSYDHSIPIIEGKKPLYRPLYSLSEIKAKVLKVWINDNL